MNGKKLGLLLLAFAVFISGCAKKEEGLGLLLPPSGFMEGWKLEGKPKYFTPDDLYEYIDGEAELYISYGFRELISATYSFRGSEDDYIVLDIFDMGSLLNAFGIYSSFRRPGLNFERIGVEGIVSEYQIKFYQANYIVELSASKREERFGEAMRRLAMLVSERIGRVKEPPAELTLLPEEGRIPGSEKYISQGYLGHDFLPRALEAEYAVGRDTVKAFVVFFSSADSAAASLGSFRGYLEGHGSELRRFSALDSEGLSAKTPYHGYIVAVLKGRFLVGLSELSSPKAGGSLLEKMLLGVPVEGG